MDLELPENHQETLHRFITACQADARIVAAFLGGSHADNKADKFSDLDLFFITTDKAYDDFLEEKESFVRLLGEPLFLDDFGVPHGYCFITSNGTEGEFWFGRESKFRDIYDGPFKVLFDQKNILARNAFPMLLADRTKQDELLRRQIDGVWHELSHFIKAMGRKQLWFACGQIEAMRRICVVLARLNDNFLDTYVEESEPYFKIEMALPVGKLSPLQSTFCLMDFDAMLQATQVICKFYLDLAPRLAEALKLPYSTNLENILMDELQELSAG